MRLFAELSKSKEERRLPEDLLQGLDALCSSDRERLKLNTIDHYFVSRGREPNPVKESICAEEDGSSIWALIYKIEIESTLWTRMRG